MARERSEFLQFEWFIQLADWTYEQLMYIDETAVNEKTLDRSMDGLVWGNQHVKSKALNEQRSGVSCQCIRLMDSSIERSFMGVTMPIYLYFSSKNFTTVRSGSTTRSRRPCRETIQHRLLTGQHLIIPRNFRSNATKSK